MSPREAGIRSGHKEWFYLGDWQISLYWELYGGPADSTGRSVIKSGFTVDRRHHSTMPKVVRYETLEEADAAIELIKNELAISIAKQAFGLH